MLCFTNRIWCFLEVSCLVESNKLYDGTEKIKDLKKSI